MNFESIGGRKWIGFLALVGVASAALFLGKMGDVVWAGWSAGLFAAFVAGNVVEHRAELNAYKEPGK